jgi:hypothetical protein
VYQIVVRNAVAGDRKCYKSNSQITAPDEIREASPTQRTEKLARNVPSVPESDIPVFRDATSYIVFFDELFVEMPLVRS